MKVINGREQQWMRAPNNRKGRLTAVTFQLNFPIQPPCQKKKSHKIKIPSEGTFSYSSHLQLVLLVAPSLLRQHSPKARKQHTYGFHQAAPKDCINSNQQSYTYQENSENQESTKAIRRPMIRHEHSIEGLSPLTVIIKPVEKIQSDNYQDESSVATECQGQSQGFVVVSYCPPRKTANCKLKYFGLFLQFSQL